MMEAVRVIQSMGLKPRRTIRVALWSGEEEGLLGSLAYVKQHFGTAEDPKPEWQKLDAYFNVDTGTGRIRGASVFGPPEAAAALRPVFWRTSPISAWAAPAPPTAAPPAAPTTRHSITPGCRVWAAAGPHRIQRPDPPHQPRYLRAHLPEM